MKYIWFNFRMPCDLKEELKNEAKAKGLSISAYVRLILAERKK